MKIEESTLETETSLLDTTFPVALLDQSTEERLKYFKGVFTKHPNLETAHNELLNNIYDTNGENIIFVVGPPGAGKTTLLRGVIKAIIERERSKIESDPGYVPFASLLTLPPERGRSFDWSDIYRRILVQLNEPMIDQKIDAKRGAKNQNYNLLETGGKLRQSYENAIRYRGVWVNFFDEAQHFNKVTGVRASQDQMDIIKTLASSTKATIVLVGTFELLDLWDLSGQINRRSREIHLARYRIDVGQDKRRFLKMLEIFQQHLPLKQQPDLRRHWDLCYEKSLGCIGILKDWLYDTLSYTLKNGNEIITKDSLMKCSLNSTKLHRLMREIHEGERRLIEAEDNRNELRKLLGLDIISEDFGKNGNQSSGRKKPGQRNPERDPVSR